MGFLDFFKRRKVVVAGHVSAHAPKFFGEMRKGMWVVSEERIGIIREINDEGIADVMLVQDDGTNLMAISTLAGNLRMAKLAEIPVARRPGKELGVQFGYF